MTLAAPRHISKERAEPHGSFSAEQQLAENVRRFIAEHEGIEPPINPVQRRLTFQHMKAALRGYDAEMEARRG